MKDNLALGGKRAPTWHAMEFTAPWDAFSAVRGHGADGRVCERACPQLLQVARFLVIDVCSFCVVFLVLGISKPDPCYTPVRGWLWCL